MKEYEEKYWASRSKQYNSTNWVKNTSFMDAFLSLLPQYNFQNILEIGIGTGVVALEMINRVQKVTGIDISEEMMSSIQHPRIETHVGDAHCLKFSDNYFDLIYMRNVLHYLDNPQRVVSQIERCLDNYGYFLFSQVIPFSDEISKEYDWLINRNIHYPKTSEIIELFSNFTIVNQTDFVLESQSVMNWLNNTCTEETEKEEIVKRHQQTSNEYRTLVNYSEVNNDIFVNIKHLMILAQKL